ARSGDREFDDDITFEPAGGGASWIDRRNFHDREVFAVTDSEADAADVDAAAQGRRGHRYGERVIEVGRVVRARRFRLLFRLRGLLGLLLLRLDDLLALHADEIDDTV